MLSADREAGPGDEAFFIVFRYFHYCYLALFLEQLKRKTKNREAGKLRKMFYLDFMLV